MDKTKIATTDKNFPIPLFDTLDFIQEQFKECQKGNPKDILTSWLNQCFKDSGVSFPVNGYIDYLHILNFLYSYRGSQDTFNAYRRELERLVQWSWMIQKKSILELKRFDIEAFIEFCQKPEKNWIGIKTVSRFINEMGVRTVNKEWRPFIVKVSKKSFKKGDLPVIEKFELSSEGIKQIFAILGSFYNYLIQEEATEINPVLQIRQKSKFIRKQQKVITIRRLSAIQWDAVIETAFVMAAENPILHERTLFIINALYRMYLRISELAASKRWTPMMRDFFRDSNGDWWFKTVGKGNKLRQVAIDPEMFAALKRWRIFLGLSPIPSIDELTPLIPKNKGKGAIESTRAIRNIVQECFDKAVEKLIQENKNEEAEMLRSVTVHWLRHTGISDDVKVRPKEHVRDDAGHSSSAITDRYIDVELKERAASAKKKRSEPVR